VDSAGNESDNYSMTAAISGNGRFVAFDSRARNLVWDDTNWGPDVFVHDRETGVTTRVSVSSDGAGTTYGISVRPAISAGGRLVVFESSAPSLVADDTNGTWDIFVHDLDTRVTTRVSVASDGSQSNNSSGLPSISSDGRFVAFMSNATNLVPGDTNTFCPGPFGIFLNCADIFVHDLQTGETTLVSVASDGAQANNLSFESALSANGRFVAFTSIASNLIPDDSNGDNSDVFVHDRWTGTTELASPAMDGTQDYGLSYRPAISANGRFVAYDSVSGNMVEGDNNLSFDVFVRDRGRE
jgi:Tol biopolymer transport system component